MNDEKTALTPAEINTGQTDETKVEQEEASDLTLREANEQAHAAARKTILDSAARFEKPVAMLGRVHSDI